MQEMHAALDAQIRTSLTALVEAGTLPLPVLPEAATKLVTIVEDPRCDVREVAEVVRRDPALTAHVVRLASSPLYAGAVKVTSLQHVIARCGLAAVAQLALVVASRARVFAVRGFEAEVQRSFRHSFATALYAQDIARARRATVDLAFLAGLLHDIGHPVLLQALVDLHAQLGVARPDDAVLIAAADEGHAEIGGRLAVAWKLPERVASSVRDHHRPGGCELALTVAVADALAHGEPVSADHAGALNLYPEDIAAFAAKAGEIAATVEAIS
jgi:putative nucleotidyltransferase with HDIG domain